MESQLVTYTFHVGMTCEGCSGAVSRILSKIEPIQDFTCDIEAKTVTIRGQPNLEQEIEDKLLKWAKASDKEVKFISKS